MDAQHQEQRRRHVTATDAPAILGLSRFRSILDVFQEKLGLGEEITMSERMRWGLRFEQSIADAYHEETGRTVTRPAEPFSSRTDLGYPAGCSLDFMTEIEAEPASLEVKSTSVKVETIDDVPEEWLAQAAHQMLVLNLPRAALAILSMGSWKGPRLLHFDLQRSEKFEAHLVQRELDFWNHVLLKEPPEPDETRHAIRALQRMYPAEIPGSVVELPSDLAYWVDTLEEANAQIAKAKKVADGAKAHIIAAMGAAEKGVMADGRVFTLKTQKGGTYTVTRKSKRVLRRAKR